MCGRVKVLRVMERYLDTKEEYNKAVKKFNKDSGNSSTRREGLTTLQTATAKNKINKMLDDYILTTYCVLQAIENSELPALHHPALAYVSTQIDKIVLVDSSCEVKKKFWKLKKHAAKMVIKSIPVDDYDDEIDKKKKDKKEEKKSRALKREAVVFSTPATTAAADEKVQAKQKERRRDTVERKRRTTADRALQEGKTEQKSIDADATATATSSTPFTLSMSSLRSMFSLPSSTSSSIATTDSDSMSKASLITAMTAIIAKGSDDAKCSYTDETGRSYTLSFSATPAPSS